MSRRALLVLAAGFEGGLLLLALVLGKVLTAPPFVTLGLSAVPALWGLAGCLPMLAMLWAIERSEARLFAGVKRDVEVMVARLFANGRMADLALVSLMAGIAEEALFRGVVQPALAMRLGVPAAILLAAGAFGLAHAVSASYALYAGIVGVYLGILLELSGNILVPMMVHGIYDFIALAWLVRLRSAA